jgi:TctA family transporter
MESLGNLLYGSELALSPYNLFIAGTGVFLGAIIGVLPGLGGTSGVAILLPLTFAMPPPRLRSSSFLVFTGEFYSAAPLRDPLEGGSQVIVRLVYFNTSVLPSVCVSYAHLY